MCFGVSAIKTLHFLIHVLSAVCKKKKCYLSIQILDKSKFSWSKFKHWLSDHTSPFDISWILRLFLLSRSKGVVEKTFFCWTTRPLECRIPTMREREKKTRERERREGVLKSLSCKFCIRVYWQILYTLTNTKRTYIIFFSEKEKEFFFNPANKQQVWLDNVQN